VNSYPTPECDYQIHVPQGITLHNCALQTQHNYAQKIKYTLKWFRLRSTDALQT